MCLEDSIRSENYKDWPDYARDAFDERIAIGRESAHVPDGQDTPDHIAIVALLQAETEMKLCGLCR